MRLVFYILFLNPLVVAVANWAAWSYFGLIGLAAVLILPILPYLADSKLRKGVWSYIAGLQLFYLSSLIGGMVMYHGFESGNFWIILIGGLLILPAAVLAIVFTLFN